MRFPVFTDSPAPLGSLVNAPLPAALSTIYDVLSLLWWSLCVRPTLLDKKVN